MTLLGRPVFFDRKVPPGVIVFVDDSDTEYPTGISVRWLYRALTKAPPRFRVDAYWVARCAKDITDALAREGVPIP